MVDSWQASERVGLSFFLLLGGYCILDKVK